MSRIGPSRARRSLNSGFIAVEPFNYQVDLDTEIGMPKAVRTCVRMNVDTAEHDGAIFERDQGHCMNTPGRGVENNRDNVTAAAVVIDISNANFFLLAPLRACAILYLGPEAERRMPTRLDRAINLARDLPEDQQNVVAALIEEFARNQTGGVYGLSPEEEQLLDEGIAELDRGERVSHNEIKALLAKYRQ